MFKEDYERLQDEVKSLKGAVALHQNVEKAANDELERMKLQVSEMRLALEIAKPSTIHVYSGHVYGADDKLVEFVDGCARCRIEKILAEGSEKRHHEYCDSLDPFGRNKPCNCQGREVPEKREEDYPHCPSCKSRLALPEYGCQVCGFK